MRSQRFHSDPARSREGAAPRGFTLLELLVVIVIIVIVVAVAVPSIVTMTQDMQVKRAQSEVYAALSVARSRAIRDRKPIALHIFRDTPVYAADRDNTTNPNVAAYNQSLPLRWGRGTRDTTDPAPDNHFWYGIPHVPTGKLTIRLEVPNTEDHVDPTDQSIEFVWTGDHDPIILPDSVGVARPNTSVDWRVPIDASNVAGGPRVDFYEDFYIVFGDDGKPTTVLVDYDIRYDRNNPKVNPTVTNVYVGSTGTQAQDAYSNPIRTWSTSGLSLYDVATFRSLQTVADQNAFLNRPENIVTVSPYTGLPITQEAKQ